MTRFVITHHALSRFRERYLCLALSFSGSDEELLLSELKRSVPFLAQRGPAKLYLLPCGCVAAVVRDHRVLVVKTILTREQVLEQIQAEGMARKRLAS